MEGDITCVLTGQRHQADLGIKRKRVVLVLVLRREKMITSKILYPLAPDITMEYLTATGK